MSLRAIQERTKSINVENDLRGLGATVRDRPPQYELHLKICDGKEPELRALSSQRGFHSETRGINDIFFVTPGSLSVHDQAVWHFFLVTELFKHSLISHAEIRFDQPIEAVLTHRMDRKQYVRSYDASQAISFDASVALHMMKAGYWKTHFSEERIRKDVSEKGYSDIHMDKTQLFILHNEIVNANSNVEKEGHRNAQ